MCGCPVAVDNSTVEQGLKTICPSMKILKFDINCFHTERENTGLESKYR